MGSAWVATKAQRDQVIAILRSKAGVKARIETHLIPRDKSGLVSFLNSRGSSRPISTVEINNDPLPVQ